MGIQWASAYVPLTPKIHAKALLEFCQALIRNFNQTFLFRAIF